MPMKNMFRTHKKTKHLVKRGIHTAIQDCSETPTEPPDQGTRVGQSKKADLHKAKSFCPTVKTPAYGSLQTNATRLQFRKHSEQQIQCAQTPLSRAATAPILVTSKHGGLVREASHRPAPSSFSNFTHLESSEAKLHDQRLKDITKLDSYMSYLRHTTDDDDLPFVPNRLCCAQVIKTLFLRHEKQYVSFLKGRLSPNDTNSQQTPTSHIPRAGVDGGRESDSGRLDDFESCASNITGENEEFKANGKTSVAKKQNKVHFVQDFPVPRKEKAEKNMWSPEEKKIEEGEREEEVEGFTPSFYRQTRCRLPVVVRGHRASTTPSWSSMNCSAFPHAQHRIDIHESPCAGETCALALHQGTSDSAPFSEGADDWLETPTRDPSICRRDVSMIPFPGDLKFSNTIEIY